MYLVCRGQNLAEDHPTRYVVTKVQSRENEFHEVAAIVVIADVKQRPICLALLKKIRS